MAFTGTLDKCKACDKTVYVMDLMTLEGMPYHKSCFRCSHCNGTLVVYNSNPLLLLPKSSIVVHKTCFRCAHSGCPLTHSSYAALNGVLYCKVHFNQLFLEKGSYNHVHQAAANHRRTASSGTSSPPSEPVNEEEKPSENEATPKEEKSEEEAVPAAAEEEQESAAES